MTTAQQTADSAARRELTTAMQQEARKFVRDYVARNGKEPTGEQVGTKFGMSERWGRNQISAVRDASGTSSGTSSGTAPARSSGTAPARRHDGSGTASGTATGTVERHSGTPERNGSGTEAARGTVERHAGAEQRHGSGTDSGTAARPSGTASGTAARPSGTVVPATAVISGTAAAPAAARPAAPPAQPGTPRGTAAARPSGTAAQPSGTPAGTAEPQQRRNIVAITALLVIGAGAFVSIWGGWVGLGKMTGFGEIELLPGLVDGWKFDTAITLPLGMEAYAAFALKVWLVPPAGLTEVGRRFARWSAIAALCLGALGQIAYHVMAANKVEVAPVWIVMFVACLPVGVLGCAAALAHLVRHPERGHR